MITENYKNFLRACFTGLDTPFITTAGTSYDFALDTDGVLATSYRPALGLYSQYFSTSNTPGVTFGRGATPASASDYTLEDMIPTSQYNVVLPKNYRRIVTEDGKTLYTATYSIRNTSETELTINEIGLIASFYGDSYATSTSGKRYHMLVDRTVLEEPLIIPPGEIRALTYNLEFDLNFE